MKITDLEAGHDGPWGSTVHGGPWTRHGHPIPGRTTVGELRPSASRCGGVERCKVCQADAEQLTMSPVAGRPTKASTALFQSGGEGKPWRPIPSLPAADSLAEVLAAMHDFVTQAGPDDLLVLRPAQAVAILNGADDVRRAVDELGRFTAPPRQVEVQSCGCVVRYVTGGEVVERFCTDHRVDRDPFGPIPRGHAPAERPQEPREASGGHPDTPQP